MDCSPPDSCNRLTLDDLPLGFAHNSRPPLNGSSGFSRYNSPLPPSLKILYDFLKLSLTLSNTLSNFAFLCDSSFSVISTKFDLLVCSCLNSTFIESSLSWHSAYCSIANIFTGPCFSIALSRALTRFSASPTEGRLVSGGAGSMLFASISASSSLIAASLLIIERPNSSLRRLRDCAFVDFWVNSVRRLARSSTRAILSSSRPLFSSNNCVRSASFSFNSMASVAIDACKLSIISLRTIMFEFKVAILDDKSSTLSDKSDSCSLPLSRAVIAFAITPSASNRFICAACNRSFKWAGLAASISSLVAAIVTFRSATTL